MFISSMLVLDGLLVSFSFFLVVSMLVILVELYLFIWYLWVLMYSLLWMGLVMVGLVLGSGSRLGWGGVEGMVELADVGMVEVGVLVMVFILVGWVGR